MTTVKVKVDQKLFELVMAKLPWLSYDSIEAFVNDAARSRFETLLELIAKTKN
jgi:hypothetical protein